MKYCLSVVAVLFLLLPLRSWAELFYYRDEVGTLRAVERESDIPLKFRPKAKSTGKRAPQPQVAPGKSGPTPPQPGTPPGTPPSSAGGSSPANRPLEDCSEAAKLEGTIPAFESRLKELCVDAPNCKRTMEWMGLNGELQAIKKIVKNCKK